MNSNIKNLLREKISRINITKKELKKNILKSISQNNNINNYIKIYANYINTKNKIAHSVITRKHKICFLTGKRGCILKNFSFSRYTLKKLILSNKLTNVKKIN